MRRAGVEKVHCRRLALFSLVLLSATLMELWGQEQADACLLLQVRAAESGEALAGATVMVTTWGRGGAAGVDGILRICGPSVDNLRVRVSSLGYITMERKLEREEWRNDTIRFDLTPQSDEGDAVTVYGHAEEAGSSASVLSGNRLQEALGATLAETLRGVGGVAVRSIGPAAAQPVVRGMSGDRVRIAENGVSTADAAGFSADHATSLDPIGVRRISVVRGPAAFVYSSTPLGGAINVERSGPAEEKFFSGGITSSFRSLSRGGAIGGAIAVRPVDRFAVDLEGSYRNEGDQRSPSFAIPNSDIRTTQVGAALSFRPDSLLVSGRVTRYSSEYGVPFDGTEAHPEGVRIAMEKDTYLADMEVRPESRLIREVHLTGRVTRYQHREIESGGLIGTEYGIVTTSVDATVDHRVTGNGGPSGLARVGGEQIDFVANGLLIDPSVQTTLYGVVHEHLAVGILEFAASLRFDRAHILSSPLGNRSEVERNFTGLSGGIGAEYHPLPLLSLSANLLRSFRPPSINELLSRGPHAANYAYEVGNDRLAPERGLGAEVAAEYEGKIVGSELRLYSYHFDSYLMSRPTGDTNRASGLAVYRFENVNARILGFEWDALLQPTEDLSFRVDANGTWGTGSGEGEGGKDMPLREIPPVKVGGEMRWERGPWGGMIRLDGFLAQNRVGAFESPTDGGATMQVDLRRSFGIGTTLHSVMLAVDNLLDAKVYDHLSRTKDQYPMAGRSVEVKYRMVW